MLDVEERGAITIVRFAHGKVNALDVELLQALADVLGSLPSAQPVVLTGAGRAFCAGVDLKRIAEGGTQYVEVFLPALSKAINAVFYHPGPVVAAVNGHAIAGGCVLAAACDLRLMSQGTIGLSEMRVGVAFPTAALEVMRHAAGPGVSRLVLNAELMGPAAAAAIGLIDRVTTPEALLDEAIAEAGRLAKISADVYAFTKRQLQGPARIRIEANSRVDDDTAKAIWAAPGTQAAISGFLASLR